MFAALAKESCASALAVGAPTSPLALRGSVRCHPNVSLVVLCSAERSAHESR